MRRVLSTCLIVSFLSVSTVAAAEEPLSGFSRFVHGAVGATLTTLAAATTSLGGYTGLNAIYHGVMALGVPAAASPAVVSAGIGVVLGGGLYLLTRAIVGNGPNPWVQGAPGLVSGAVLTAIGGYAVVHLGLAIAAGGAMLGASLVGAGIIAALGVGLLAYGAYRVWKAYSSASEPGGSNVGRGTLTRPTGPTWNAPLAVPPGRTIHGGALTP